ncbi:MAG: response regulator [Okeania sp. SIO3B5]|uniref:response regulator n=1 Tax=Okeania sp. SIO3B5 TaxID=2607811 RepID=UPI001400DE9D|nr:response regulator [Okeania sp. SIO3B5]NEO58665.1 response regulator [Okeania sp. SIO3B5]
MSKILVVDDQHSHRQMIINLLKKSGLKVKSANNGLEALEQIEIHKPDLIILDIVMPDINGYEVCRRIRSSPSTKDLPIIFCSIKGEDFDHYWGIRQGANAYIAKPFQPGELISTVKRLLK